MLKILEYVPLQVRVLYRQFLLRVFDLEALAIQADIPRFLGQFASILVFISVIGALGLLSAERATATPEGYLSFVWGGEQALISGMMFVVGLVSVVTWDSTFPDRRDVMVLAPLPVASRTILIAKIAASASLLGLAILALNFLTGIAWPLLIGSHHYSAWGFLQSLAAYWATMVSASAFVFCSMLTLQGFGALLLPRRLFLVFSAVLQTAAFGIVFAAYFLVPSITTPADMVDPANRATLAWSPSFWFFGFFNQLNGSLPHELAWLASRAWIALAIAVFGAAVSLLLCYLHTMKKTIEQPDLVPGSRGPHWTPSLGNSVRAAIVLFSLRSLTRSRQHRLAFAFSWAVIFSNVLVWLRSELSAPTHLPLDAEFLTSTFVMMTLAVFGLRCVFSLPISLTANWMLRTTQLSPPERYVDGTRFTMLVLAVLPVWLISAVISLALRPVDQVLLHLLILAFLGWIFVEISLIGFYKVPFTCSYLPGKVHVQVLFWCFLLLMVVFSLTSAELELPALASLVRSMVMLAILAVAASALRVFNQHRAKSAVLYFEERPAEVITSLGLTWISPSRKELGSQGGA